VDAARGTDQNCYRTPLTHAATTRRRFWRSLAIGSCLPAPRCTSEAWVYRRMRIDRHYIQLITNAVDDQTQPSPADRVVSREEIAFTLSVHITLPSEDLFVSRRRADNIADLQAGTVYSVVRASVRHITCRGSPPAPQALRSPFLCRSIHRAATVELPDGTTHAGYDRLRTAGEGHRWQDEYWRTESAESATECRLTLNQDPHDPHHRALGHMPTSARPNAQIVRTACRGAGPRTSGTQLGTATATDMRRRTSPRRSFFAAPFTSLRQRRAPCKYKWIDLMSPCKRSRRKRRIARRM